MYTHTAAPRATKASFQNISDASPGFQNLGANIFSVVLGTQSCCEQQLSEDKSVEYLSCSEKAVCVTLTRITPI